jgi:hypothetical protein
LAQVFSDVISLPRGGKTPPNERQLFFSDLQTLRGGEGWVSSFFLFCPSTVLIHTERSIVMMHVLGVLTE